MCHNIYNIIHKFYKKVTPKSESIFILPLKVVYRLPLIRKVEEGNMTHLTKVKTNTSSFSVYT